MLSWKNNNKSTLFEIKLITSVLDSTCKSSANKFRCFFISRSTGRQEVAEHQTRPRTTTNWPTSPGITSLYTNAR